MQIKEGASDSIDIVRRNWEIFLSLKQPRNAIESRVASILQRQQTLKASESGSCRKVVIMNQSKNEEVIKLSSEDETPLAISQKEP
jgi:hypothetical protein